MILAILQQLAQRIPDEHTLTMVGPIGAPKDFIRLVETNAQNTRVVDARHE